MPDGDEVELGAVGPELRLWRAREAARQGELALQHQSFARENIQSRATALLGWAVTASIASIGGVTLGGGHPGLRTAAWLTLIWQIVTAFACIIATFPRRWARPGHDPRQILDSPQTSELQILEGLAAGLDEDVALNRATLIRVGIALRVAWIVFSTTPLPAAIALLGLGAT